MSRRGQRLYKYVQIMKISCEEKFWEGENIVNVATAICPHTQIVLNSLGVYPLPFLSSSIAARFPAAPELLHVDRMI